MDGPWFTKIAAICKVVVVALVQNSRLQAETVDCQGPDRCRRTQTTATKQLLALKTCPSHSAKKKCEPGPENEQ